MRTTSRAGLTKLAAGRGDAGHGMLCKPIACPTVQLVGQHSIE